MNGYLVFFRVFTVFTSRVLGGAALTYLGHYLFGYAVEWVALGVAVGFLLGVYGLWIAFIKENNRKS
jgi:hypothetical protein